LDRERRAEASRVNRAIVGHRNADEGSSDEGAAQLFAALYDELHQLAERQLRRGGAEVTLGATALLHEAYLHLAGREGVHFPDRARFMGYAARAMRGIIVDHARRAGAQKRGRALTVTLTESAGSGTADGAVELDRLSDALDELAAIEPALAELVDLHFFCGYGLGEIAALREVSERTVQRDWRKARLLLHRALRETPEAGCDAAGGMAH
jgi:RNA polymerase sigma factor (TIGR02999 family)